MAHFLSHRRSTGLSPRLQVLGRRSGGVASRAGALSFALVAAAFSAACGSDEGDPDGAGGGGAGGGAGGAGAVGGGAGDDGRVPGAEWTFATPAEAGMDAALLEQACDYALRFDGNADGRPDTHTQGVVIVRGGAIVHECYASAGQYGTDGQGRPIPPVDKGPGDPATSWSVAKSFISTLIGIAIDEGLIDGVDVPMSTFFPEWASDARAAITLKDVLWMQSGLKFIEEYVDLNSEIVQLFNSADGNAFARNLRYQRPPGSNWYYSSGDSQLLGAAIQTVTGKAAGAYAQEKLFDPLGMRSAGWWRDGSGGTATYCCIDATPRDFARFGLLALRRGRWGDRQVASSGWMQEATTTMATRNPGYAYQWWTQGSLANDIPQYPDLFWADGLDQQKIFVIPSLDLVVAKNTLYNKPPGDEAANPGSGVLSKITPRGIGTYGTVGPLVWEDVALLAPIINSIEGATPVPFTPTQLGARPPDPALCRELTASGAYGTFCEPVHGCACDFCSVQMLDCNTSEACSAIVNCALETGCRGIDCLTPCETVINEYGGAATGNIAIEMALQLSECTVVNQCATSCD
jgi:CubicO group peptidase (beta-lactamase class C family)